MWLTWALSLDPGCLLRTWRARNLRWDRGSTRSWLNLPGLPKNTYLAHGAMGSLYLQGRVTLSLVSLVCVVLHPRVQWWHWAGGSGCVSSGIKLLFFKLSWASILLAVSQEMTTTDPFSATPPFIKSSKSRGKPRIPEAGSHCSVPSKQRCTLHVCLKWKLELVLASKAAASKISLEPKCSSQQTALLAETKVRGRPQPAGAAEQQPDLLQDICK